MSLMLEQLVLIVVAQERRFPQGVDPFKMIARLAEECGELSAEVQHREDEGLKRAKLGAPSREKTAKELMDVLTAAIAIARHYDLMDDVSKRITTSVDLACADGLLSAEEVAAAGSA